MNEKETNGKTADDSATEPLNFINFCPHCGSNLFEARSAREFLCGACGFNFFINASAAVAAIIVDNKGRVMLTRRARDPWKGKLDLPGGFVDPGESLEQALRRELKEELGVELTSLNYLCSFPNEYVFSGFKVRTTDAAFVCTIADTNISAHDDINEIIWTEPKNIDLNNIPATSIQNIIKHYLNAL